MNSGSLPFLTGPHDAIRDGLVTLKDGACTSHPAEVIQNAGRQGVEHSKLQMLQSVYGSALPAMMSIERQILSRAERLPGIPSSRLGLEALTGELDDFSFESYLGLPSESEVQPPDLHSQMEHKLELPTKTMSRGVA